MGGGSAVVCLLWDNGMENHFHVLHESVGEVHRCCYPWRNSLPPVPNPRPRERENPHMFAEGQFSLFLSTETCSVNHYSSFPKATQDGLPSAESFFSLDFVSGLLCASQYLKVP